MHNGLVALGVILLLIGLIASIYYESKTIWGIEYQRTYPYKDMGLVLIGVGVISIALGVYYSPRKEEVSRSSI